MILSSYRYWSKFNCFPDGAQYNFIPLHDWLRAPIALNAFQRVYVTGKYDNANDVTELVVSPFDPRFWGDLWQIRLHFESGIGSLARLTEFLDSARIGVLISEGTEGDRGTFNSNGLVVSAEKYSSPIDGTSELRKEQRYCRLFDLENRISSHLIDRLDFPAGLSPRLYVRRLGQYHSLWGDWQKGRAKVFQTWILPAPGTSGMPRPVEQPSAPEECLPEFESLDFRTNRSESEPGLWLSASNLKHVVSACIPDPTKVDQYINPAGKSLVFPSLDTGERLLRITLGAASSPSGSRIHHFRISIPYDRSLIARIVRRIADRGLNIIKYQIRPGIDIRDLLAMLRRNVLGRDKVFDLERADLNDIDLTIIDQFARYCRLDITCILPTERRDNPDQIANACYEDVRDAAKMIGHQVLFVSLRGNHRTLLKHADIQSMFNACQTKSPGLPMRDAVRERFVSSITLDRPDGFGFCRESPNEVIEEREHKLQFPTRPDPLPPDDEFLNQITHQIEQFSKRRHSLRDVARQVDQRTNRTIAWLAENKLGEINPDDDYMRERFLRYLYLRQTDLPFRRHNRRVFISRSTRGADHYVLAKDRLLELGFTPSDGFDLQHGPAVDTAILAAIKNAEFFLGIWTGEDASVFAIDCEPSEERQSPSPWMPFELGMAIALGKPYALLIEKTVAETYFKKIVPHTPHFLFKFADCLKLKSDEAMGDEGQPDLESFGRQLDRSIAALMARFNMAELGEAREEIAND